MMRNILRKALTRYYRFWYNRAEEAFKAHEKVYMDTLPIKVEGYEAFIRNHGDLIVQRGKLRQKCEKWWSRYSKYYEVPKLIPPTAQEFTHL